MVNTKRVGKFEIENGNLSPTDAAQFKYTSERSIAIYKSKGAAVELVGTGFVVEHHGRYFVCTAAHLIDDNFGGGLQPRIALDGNIASLPCVKVNRTSLASDSPMERYDIGAWTLELDGGEHDQYIKSISISSDRLASTNIVDSDIPLKIVGYPISQNKSAEWQSSNDQTVKRHDLPVLTYANFDYDLKRINKSIRTHIALDWDKKDTSGQSVKSPRGLSGAPVFHFSVAGNESIVGVFIEYHKNENICVFTRAEILVDFLNKFC